MKYKLNITSDDCQFIVNEDKRKIVCIIDNTEDLFKDFAMDNLEIPYDCMDYFGCARKHLNKDLAMPKCFKGIATCAEEDEWDEENGKLLAFSKAKFKLINSFFKRADLYVKTIDTSLNRAVDTINLLGQKITASTQHRHAKLAEIFGEPENGVSEN